MGTVNDSFRGAERLRWLDRAISAQVRIWSDAARQLLSDKNHTKHDAAVSATLKMCGSEIRSIIATSHLASLRDASDVGRHRGPSHFLVDTVNGQWHIRSGARGRFTDCGINPDDKEGWVATPSGEPEPGHYCRSCFTWQMDPRHEHGFDQDDTAAMRHHLAAVHDIRLLNSDVRDNPQRASEMHGEHHKLIGHAA